MNGLQAKADVVLPDRVRQQPAQFSGNPATVIAHCDPLGCNRIWVEKTILVCSHTRLFRLGVAVESAQVNVAGGVVDPLVLAIGLEALVDDNGGEGEEESIQAGWVLLKLSLRTLEQLLVDQFGVWKVRTFGPHRRHISAVGSASLTKLRVPQIVVAAVVSSIPGRWSCYGCRRVRKIVVHCQSEMSGFVREKN